IEFSPLPLPPLRVTILDDGRIGPGSEAPDLTLQAGPGALLALARGEEEFPRVVGDVAAHRIAGVARELAAWHVDAAKRVTAAAADFLTDEAAVLVRREEHAGHARAVADPRDALARLEKRIERLA